MIRAAAARIAPYIRRTPMLRLPAGVLASVPLTLKLECLQLSGSFKARGAFNSILALPVPAAGVIAASGGNHGAAVAAAAQALGVAAEIFVPEISGEAKRARIRAFGARLVIGGANYDEARLASEARAAETGARIIHAYDQPEVLAGQGTVALECTEDAPACTHWLVAVGGGGLIGGMAQHWGADAAQHLVAVEPQGCPSLHDALAAGRPVPAPVGGLAADSLGARQVGALGFAAIAAHGVTSVLVNDAAIAEARGAIWEACRLLVEPGGAAALAALRSGAWVPPQGARVGVLLCGANTELAA
ncbi:serine/threonine dehydratase [Plastoroseomonas arctica]|nr:serine/threonine dehydratase [Plastoroseomonas arctica]